MEFNRNLKVNLIKKLRTVQWPLRIEVHHWTALDGQRLDGNRRPLEGDRRRR